MSSIAALRGPGSYGGAKAAVHAYTFELAARVGADGITVNAVAPGFVGDTEFFGDRATPEFVASRVAQTLTGEPRPPRRDRRGRTVSGRRRPPRTPRPRSCTSTEGAALGR